MNDAATKETKDSFARSAGLWALSVAVAVVVMMGFKALAYQLGADDLSTNHPVAMGVSMVAFILLNRGFRKGWSDIGRADVVYGLAVGSGVAILATLLRPDVLQWIVGLL
ncbi:hypothetical protein [Salisaeta longa]|uniref:hypothetical protein n=1 Tax=Salisaeta longa TaxID=503170 RepID=UPI00040EA6F9|nr:hypothetical protein [Salisaeta longa]